MNTCFKTIENPSEGIYREKASKFLAFAYPVENEEQVKLILEQLRKKYYDAVHHCYAFRLGAELDFFRSNDDGEPSGTAGKPILGQIQSFELTNVLIVVVRYFGGTKLGVGGLIQAYKQAALEVLTKAAIIEKNVTMQYEILFEYSLTNEILKLIKNNNAIVNIREMDNTCRFVCEVPLADEENFNQAISTLEINYKKLNS